jgi:hypothetical protein
MWSCQIAVIPSRASIVKARFSVRVRRRVMPEVYKAGDFAIERSAQQVGEVPAAFFAPFHRVTTQEDAAAEPDPRRGYEWHSSTRSSRWRSARLSP